MRRCAAALTTVLLILAGTLALPLGAQPAEAVTRTVDLRAEFRPAIRKQAGPSCTIHATVWGVSWWMAKSYGWRHPISLNWNAYLARADARGPEPRMTKVAADVRSPGYVFDQHPTARIKAQTRALPLLSDAYREALDKGQPVVLALRSVTHAVILVGYNPAGLIYANSRGTAWGDGGYGVLTWYQAATDGYQTPFAITGVTAGPR